MLGKKTFWKIFIMFVLLESNFGRLYWDLQSPSQVFLRRVYSLWNTTFLMWKWFMSWNCFWRELSFRESLKWIILQSDKKNPLMSKERETKIRQASCISLISKNPFFSKRVREVEEVNEQDDLSSFLLYWISKGKVLPEHTKRANNDWITLLKINTKTSSLTLPLF